MSPIIHVSCAEGDLHPQKPGHPCVICGKRSFPAHRRHFIYLHIRCHCYTLQHTTTHCNTLQHTATHCNTSQHIATHRNTLQHTATYCIVHVFLQDVRVYVSAHKASLQHTATHCNTLQHTATRCNTLQHTASYVYSYKMCECMCLHLAS